MSENAHLKSAYVSFTSTWETRRSEFHGNVHCLSPGENPSVDSLGISFRFLKYTTASIERECFHYFPIAFIRIALSFPSPLFFQREKEKYSHAASGTASVGLTLKLAKIF